MRRSVRLNQTRVAVAAATLAAAVTCLVVLYPGSSGAAATSAPVAVAAPASSFQLLREAPTGAPPAELVQAVEHAPVSFGLSLGGARQAADTGAWLIPGDGELCIAVEDSEGLGMSCASAASAASGKLMFVERSTTGAQSTVIGAAPDGTTQASAQNAAGGTVGSTPIHGSTYVLSGQGVTGATPSP
jgi:hypothetical protein